MRRNSTKTETKRGFTPSAPAWAPRGAKARSVGEFVPGLMRPAFEKFGFPAAAILTDWEAIAGPELAAFTAPERLKWPRQHSSGDTALEAPGALLILRVAGARALEVDHMRPWLIERINATFGYRAVSDIRILQAPLPQKPSSRSAGGAADGKSAATVTACEDRLSQALARIASGIEARKSPSRAGSAPS
ncbi:MAG: DUF721 domain-containing protein [Rhodomicrobium sp.]|nr:DUF721 domain-containing protein [Rhodomicrobium sp.]